MKTIKANSIIVKVVLFLSTFLFYSNLKGQADTNTQKQEDSLSYSFLKETILDYFLPDPKYNTAYFYQPDKLDRKTTVTRKVRYKKLTNKKYIITDQQFYGSNLLSYVIYEITINKDFVIATQIKTYSSLTEKAVTLDCSKFPDTLIRFTVSASDYWSMSGGSNSTYVCNVKRIKMMVDEKELDGIVLTKTEVSRNRKSLYGVDQACFNLYYVKGIGLYSVDILDPSIVVSGTYPSYPFDRLEKLTLEKSP